MAEITITKSNYKTEVLESDIPVLLDFWAIWCGPCNMLGPVVAEIAEEYAGKVKVGKVNVDEEPELAAQFGVTAIPMIAVMKNGQLAQSVVGYQPKERIEALLK